MGKRRFFSPRRQDILNPRKRQHSKNFCATAAVLSPPAASPDFTCPSTKELRLLWPIKFKNEFRPFPRLPSLAPPPRSRWCPACIGGGQMVSFPSTATKAVLLWCSIASARDPYSGWPIPVPLPMPDLKKPATLSFCLLPSVLRKTAGYCG